MTINGVTEQKSETILDLVNYSDGSNSLLDITDILNVKMTDLIYDANRLVDAGYLRFKM